MTAGPVLVVGASLVGIGVVHVAATRAFYPKSGFWLFFPVAALAAVRARASRVRG